MPAQTPPDRFQISGLKIKPKAHHQRSFPCQLAVEVQWVKAVVSIGDVQQTNRRLGGPSWKAITGERIELPKVIVWRARSVTFVILGEPKRFSFGEKSAAMIVNRSHAQMVENSFQTLPRLEIAKSSRRETFRHIDKIILQRRLAYAIACAK